MRLNLRHETDLPKTFSEAALRWCGGRACAFGPGKGERSVARGSGGALIDSGNPVFNQFAVERPGEILRTRPLWDSGWRGAYAVELVMRRIFHLI